MNGRVKRMLLTGGVNRFSTGRFMWAYLTDYSALAWVRLGIGGDGMMQEGSGRPGEWMLTFDDGPEPGPTEAVADELEAVGGRGTFFVIGEKVRRHPDLVRRLVVRGHQVGTHSMTHARCSRLKAEALRAEVVDSKKLIEDVTGREVSWFRPPFGALRQGQVERLREWGVGVVWWNVNPKDWMGAAPEILAGRLARASARRPLVVMHDRLETVAPALALFFRARPEVRPVVVP